MYFPSIKEVKKYGVFPVKEVELWHSLNFLVDGGVQSASRLGRFRARNRVVSTLYIGGQVDTRAGLDFLKEKTVVCPYLEWEMMLTNFIYLPVPCIFIYLLVSYGHLVFYWPVPVAARSTAKVCGRLAEETVGSNPAKGMDVCLLWVLCVVW
jgi:hypothetical protein